MLKREAGQEQPYWKAGPFKIRLPLIHYPLESIEALQGVVLVVVGLAIIPLMETHLGVPYEVGLTWAVLSMALYLLPVTLGVPFVPGWITPALPLVVIFLGNYEPGPDAVKALVALHLMVSAIFFVLYITKLGGRIVHAIPVSIKGGILIGVGIAAIYGEIGEDGQITETPISIIVGGLVCLFGLFSVSLGRLRLRSKIAARIANYGILPGLIVAMLVGWMTAEYPLPDIQWGLTEIDLTQAWQYSPFVLGFPGIDMFVAAIPTALIAYIIAYGDIIVGEEIVKRESRTRTDEILEIDIDRLHLATGIRNLLHGLFAPHPGLAGPIFTAVTTSISARFAFGRRAMESLYSGVGTFYFVASAAIFFLPLITLFQPVLPIALSLTLLITGYVCMLIGMAQLKTSTQQGIAGITGVVLAIEGTLWGIATGIVLYILLERTSLFPAARTPSPKPGSGTESEIPAPER
ncbi:solute carrier family 23 protein [Rhodococcus rhodochrous]|uniref:solute carrier family 23 protein n=1 Tax=Rhodococcus rhodochrous TaxID=1829 RepID=UPI001930F624|nr:solute carrier family 23 protein [Rhodococcus rhodochrous]